MSNSPRAARTTATRAGSTGWLLRAMVASLALAQAAVVGCTAPEALMRLAPGAGGNLRRGIELFNSGDLKGARPYLEKGVLEEPSEPNAHLYLGLACLKAKEPQLARRHFETALKLAPQNDRVHFYLSEMARERRDFETAERHLRSALDASPGNFAILNNLGLVCCEQKKFKQAIGFYTQAIDKNRSSFVTYYNLGEAYRKSEQYSNALQVFQDAQKLAPENVYLTFSMAETYFFLKKHEDALKQYGKILISPTRFDQIGRVHFQMGVIFYAQGKMSEAQGCFDLAARTRYDRMLVHVWQAKVELRLGHYSAAMKLLDQAEAARARSGRGNPAQVRYYQGVVALNLNRADEAVAHFKAALLFDLPRDRIFAQLGAAFLKKALAMPSTVPREKLEPVLEEAHDNFVKCLAIDKENLVALLGDSQVLFMGKEFEESLAVAQQVLALQKDHPAAMLQQALCFYQLKRMPEAIGGLEACLVCEPTNTNVMFFLAQIYAQMGRYADAEALFQRGLTLEPRNVDAMLLLASVFAKTGRYQDSSVMLNRILKAEGNAEVKSEARELFALVSKTYRDIVDLSKTGIKAKLGTAEYVDKRLQSPRELLDKAKTAALTPDERATLQEMIDRLVLDNNYLLQNGMFQSEAVQKRYADGLKALVDELQKL